MLIRGSSGSIQRRSSDAPLGNFFFEPLELDVQPTNLLVEFRLRNDLLGSPSHPVEDSSRFLDESLLPLMNQRGMNSEPLCDYCDRLSLPDRFQRDPSLEPRLIPLLALAISCLHACWSVQCQALA